MNTPRTGLAPRAVLVALAVLALALQSIYLLNAIRWIDAPDRGWIAMIQLGPDVVAVARPLGVEAGLRDGDRIVALNGESYETFDELWALLDYEIGRVNTYQVLRDGEHHIVELENLPLGFRRVFMQSGVFWLLGTAITLLGFLVFAMKPFHAPSWAFLSMCVALGVMIPHFAPSHHVFEPAFLNNVILWVVPLVPATILTLAMLFPQRKAGLVERRRWLLLPYALSFGLGLASRYHGTWVGFLPPLLLQSIYIYLLVAVLAFLASTIWDYLRTDSVAVRLQALVIFTGVLLSFLIPVSELLSNLLLGASFLPNLIVGYAVCIFVFPLAIGYAIARHDLFEISTVVRRTYGYVLSSGVIIGGYGLVLSLLEWTTSANVSDSAAFRLTFLLVVAFSFEPIHRRSQDFVDGIFYRRRYDYRKTLRETIEAMTSILDPRLVQSTFLGALVEQMQLENGMLLLPEGGAGAYRSQLALGFAEARPEELAIGSDEALLEQLEHGQNPLFRHDVDLAPALEHDRPALQQRFDELGAEAVIAMRYQSKTVGLVALGQKKSGRMFSLEDLDLLQTMTHQTAIALQNASLFDDLAASLKRIQILESVKTNLAKFVPQTVQNLIEKSPDSAGLFDKRETDLSVVFADMEGYTRLSSQLPLEEVNAIVELYFGAFLDEILRCGGDVNETAGDGLMVLFQDDDPEAHARSAVHAAVGIQRITQELNQQRSDAVPIAMHIGVNSGVAAVGATKISGAGGGDRWTYTASGPTTNIAARVGALGHGTSITEETRRRLGDEFELESLGPQNLKNVRDPIGAYRVVGDALSSPAATQAASAVGRADSAALAEGWFRVAGRVCEQESGRPLTGLTVRAWDDDLVSDDLLGTATTDAEGRFEIRFTADAFHDLIGASLDIYLRVFDATGEHELFSTVDQLLRDAQNDTWFDLEIPRARLEPAS